VLRIRIRDEKNVQIGIHGEKMTLDKKNPESATLLLHLLKISELLEIFCTGTGIIILD
jgi:hypothetical protein